MAYISQEQKAKIAAILKPIIPKGWKYSLSVHHHSKLTLTIASAPVDLPKVLYGQSANQISVNQYHFERQFKDSTYVDLFKKIVAALNTDNYDNSDITTDYFDVGHYVGIEIGRWNKPFEVKA
jgi:hypothetical protein